MKPYKSTLTIVVLSIVLSLAWWNIWQLKAENRALESGNATLRADLAEAKGDIGDLKVQTEYFKQYSFEVVMCTLIERAEKYKVPIKTALALMMVESYFNPFAISHTGDHGLFQINSYFHKIDKRTIYIPAVNIDMGLRILSDFYKKSGSWVIAVAQYNSGKNYRLSDHPRKLRENIFMR